MESFCDFSASDTAELTESPLLSTAVFDNLDRVGVEELGLIVAMLVDVFFCVDDFLRSVLDDVFPSPVLLEALDLFNDNLELTETLPSDFLDKVVGTICELDLCFLSLSLDSPWSTPP